MWFSKCLCITVKLVNKDVCPPASWPGREGDSCLQSTYLFVQCTCNITVLHEVCPVLNAGSANAMSKILPLKFIPNSLGSLAEVKKPCNRNILKGKTLKRGMESRQLKASGGQWGREEKTS